MINPYEILEINENATEDQIKQAYRRLARKYHPDQYGDNPLKDLAENKMRELNEAYEILTKKSNNNNENFNKSNSTDNNSNNQTFYNDIRNEINKGNLSYAESKLNNMTDHNAEWNYLMGMVNLQKGWYDAAYNYINIACSMSPFNNEYKIALDMLKHRNNSYRAPYNNSRRNDPDFCNICVKLWCLDSICECLGGDLISCC